MKKSARQNILKVIYIDFKMCFKKQSYSYIGTRLLFFMPGGIMRLVIRKSALLELAKGMNGDSFEKIKAAIIAHLKGLENQEDDPELAKAAEQLNSDEYMFSHLEKSLDGEWIEKAGYGIGTVRTWRGKKYKKIAQGKWVRVYDKVDRGAKNAMTRLIHQAERIDTPEEMMKFVLANKQRFSDANGKPLDIVDRLNAVIDGKTYAGKKTELSKVVKPAKLKNEEHKQFEEIKNKTASKQTEQKPEKQSSFSMSDIGNSEKKIKDMQQAKDIIKEIAQKDGVTSKGREKLEDFISYNIGGSSPLFDKIYSEFGVSPGDLDDDFEAAYDMILKNALGKDTSKERKKIDDSFAKQTARERKMFLDDDKKFQKEYKAEKNNSGGKSSRFEPSDSTAIGKKEVIAEPVSQSAGTVEFPKTKETKTEFEQLAKCVSKDKTRYFMQGVYYDKENGVLAATDGRRLKVVKVGDLTGFDKSGYVNIDTNGKNIAITHNDAMPEYAQFPPYKKVIPGDSSMKIRANLDNRVLAEKIKAMKEDGRVSKRDGKGELDTIRIDFEKDGNVMLDGTKIGSIGKQNNDLPPLYMNVHYLTDAISAGKTSVLSLQEPNANGFTRPMTMNTGCSSSVIATMNYHSIDYEERRAEAKQLKAKKDKEITNRLELNKKLIEKDKENFYLSPDKIKEKIETISTLSDEDLSRNLKFANVDLDLLARKYDFSNSNRNVKETGLSVFHTVRTKIAFDKYPEIKTAIEKEMQKRGLSTQVKKSDSLYDYVQKSIAVLKECRAI